MNARPAVAMMVLLLLEAACSGSPRPIARSAFDPAPWFEDLAQLEDQLGQHYSNLEWNQRHRGLDLPELDAATRTELSRARSEQEALEALVHFIAAFRDPHLAWTAPAPSVRYDIKLTSDGAAVRVRSAGPGACGAQPGDVVDTVQDLPAMEQLQARLPFSTFPNPALRRDDALRTFTSSPFAPADALRLGLRREGMTHSCVLRPLSPAPVSEPGTVTPAAETPGAAACEAMGISASTAPPSPLLFRPERRVAFTPSSSRGWPGAGTVHLASGQTLGWLRIPLFSEEAYPAACAEAWGVFRGGLSAPCDEKCQEGFRERVLAPRLVGEIAARLDAFRAARVSGVVVDVTDNGGGTDWVGDVARLLFAGELTCPAGSEVREPGAVERASRHLQALEACAGAKLDAEARRALDANLEWARAVRADAAQPCDWRPSFRAGAPVPACSMLTRSRRAPCAPPPVQASSLPPGCTAFRASSTPPKARGLVDAPVYVLINRRTGSAAEAFAAILRDNQAATLVGEQTVGAGCGYADGGNEVRLKHSGLKVRMPNCVRYRLDGTNEVEGIAPDLPVSWTGEDLARFDSYAEKILAGADSLFAPR